MNQTIRKNPKALLIEVREQLGIYVYALVDPRDHQVFYVGKGTGDRILAHAKEAKEAKEIHTAKLDRIRAIEQAGHEVTHYFIRTGIKSNKEAFAVEQGAIDALKLAGMELTNLAAGHGSRQSGAMLLSELMTELAAPPAPAINEPTVIFKVNRLWSKGMDEPAVAEITRGFWKIGVRSRARAQIAIAVASGIVRGVYRIEPGSWHKGNRNTGDKNRWGFNTLDVPQYRHLIGTQVRAVFPKGSQTPFRLFLDGFPGAAKYEVVSKRSKSRADK